MAVEGVAERPTGPSEAWADRFLQRVDQEPWVLGGAVVICLFALATLSLAIFALLYGCCCGSGDGRRMKTPQGKDGVI